MNLLILFIQTEAILTDENVDLLEKLYPVKNVSSRNISSY